MDKVGRTHQYSPPMQTQVAWRALSKARISGDVGTGAGFGAATGMARATEAKTARMAMNFMVAVGLGWVVRDTMLVTT